MIYSQEKFKGVMQAIPTKRLQQVKPEPKNSGVDSWVHDQIRPRKKEMITDIRDIVCTDGFNNISRREPFYKNPVPPFYPTDKTLFDILPTDIVKKLSQCG